MQLSVPDYGDSTWWLYAIRLRDWPRFRNRASGQRRECGRHRSFFAADYDVATFWSSDNGTGSPWIGAIVLTSSFKCWMFRYKLTLFAW